jgi:hypothetical protein
MRSMTSKTIKVSSDIPLITDQFMLRQLPNVPREQAEALVKLVLECATEAAPDTRELRNFTGRISKMEAAGDRERAIFAVDRADSYEPLLLQPVTPSLTTPEGQAMAARLNDFIGKRVTLGLGREVEGQRKLLVIHSVRAAD